MRVLAEPSKVKVGAGDEARTRDIQLGRLTLYQLSYSRVWGVYRAGPDPARVKPSGWQMRNRVRRAPAPAFYTPRQEVPHGRQDAEATTQEEEASEAEGGLTAASS
jgi:hypothetical protein